MKLSDFLIDKNKSLKDALQIINGNGKGLCFVVEKIKLLGVITDGDIRRYLLKETNLDSKVSKVMNQNFVYFHVETETSKIRESLKGKIKFIPLVDDDFNIVDIANFEKTHTIPILEPVLKGNEMKYIQECIETNWISSQGRFVSDFENLFSKLHSNQFAVSVSNGTNALHLSLETLDIGDGDEVIVPNITFAACSNAVIHCGATPVFCEINSKTWCICPLEAEKLITSKTKAIMIVHLYGQVADLHAFQELAKKYGILLIEDCAEAIGSSFEGKPVGTFGDAATFSFFGNKTISTGEGGMILFKEKDFAKKSRILRDHGMNPEKKYWHDIVGYNYRLTNIQAAIGLAQLENFNEIVQKKMMIFKWYKSLLENAKGVAQLPIELEISQNSNWLFTLLLEQNIDKFFVMKNLLKNGIESREVFYPLNEMPPYKNYSCSKTLTNSQRISQQGISLPSSVNLNFEDVSFICNTLKKYL